MGFILIICGVILLLTALSQLFWEDEYGWAKLIWTVIVEGVKFLMAITLLCIVLVVVAVTLLTRKR